MTNAPHIPVMLKEVIEYLAPKEGGIYVDGTFGAGGYSKALLESANCEIYAIDRDPGVADLFAQLEQQYSGRISFLQGTFSDMQSLLKSQGISQVDGIVLDIGVSSMQLDQPERGFSFAKEGPLDMRMSQSGSNAADLVNESDETELANILYRYGGEKRSRAIARAIAKARLEAPITTTTELASIIHSVIPKRAKQNIDPATRTFQALRIWVNDELAELEQALEAAEQLLSPEGRLVVVSFHSLEDRIVKEFMREKSGKNQGVSRYVPDLPDQKKATFRLLHSKAIVPTEEEVTDNIRARSAKLRAAEKIMEQAA